VEDQFSLEIGIDHDEYLRFTDPMLIGQFRENGLLSPPKKEKPPRAFETLSGFETALKRRSSIFY